MLKIPIAKTAVIFIALCALNLTPLAAIAIEDCGTSVTECKLRQEIKELKGQVKELQAAITVSSDGKVGIGTMSSQATLDIYEPEYSKMGFRVSSDHAKFSWTNHAMTLQQGKKLSSVPYIQWLKKDGTRQAYMGWNTGYFNLTLENGHHFSINGGNVGIGTTSPQYKLDVAGNIRGHNVSIPSDQRHKQNIYPLDNALTKLQGLRGVSFEWKNSQAQEAETQIGLIAQEVEAVLPELVSTDDEGYKSIAYGQLTAVLIEAVKEQQRIIEQKSATIAKQQEKIATQDERITSLEAMMQEMVRQVAALKRETVAQPVQMLHRVSP